MTGFQFDAIPQDNGSAESQPRLGAVPSDEIVDCELVCPRGFRGAEGVEDGAFGVVEIRKSADKC
jgi:hypothetical protein